MAREFFKDCVKYKDKDNNNKLIDLFFIFYFYFYFLKINFPSLNALQCRNLESWLERPKKRERERERERSVLVMRHLQNMVFIVYKSSMQRDKRAEESQANIRQKRERERHTHTHTD